MNTTPIKLKFSHQKFQDDAVNSVCSIFAGQPFIASRIAGEYTEEGNFLPFPILGNSTIEIPDSVIIANIRNIQRDNSLPLSETLAGKYNLTVEMETGTGKTYTYIKTIYELNRLYGWSKFVIVVPSIAIREGVYKTFQITEEHFTWDYRQKADCFIYDSANTSRLRGFVSDDTLQVMIINSQAFNSRDADTRRIYMDTDSFAQHRPIDAIAALRPIVIIDEPQSVEGAKTKESLKDFAPLFTLRYSATPKEHYNVVYRLDAVDAYRMNLVKKICVTGIRVVNASASGGYVYLKEVVRKSDDLYALVEFDVRSAGGIRRTTRRVREGVDLFAASGSLEEYRDGFTVKMIDGLNGLIEFVNGTVLTEGDISGSDEEDQKRRIQIRETIRAHLEKEQQLFRRGIKVLSLFFIDEVAKYRLYDEDGQALPGAYAKIFEEEYRQAVEGLHHGFGNEEYAKYLAGITPEETHAGYFSVDKHNRMTDSKTKRKDDTADDVSAYDLIMKDKERLLSLGEPVRFIFSHSALREGWDNPNVFQICALRNTKGEIRRRQEVGRGLRLCVNQEGERVSNEGFDVNELTVIANESYAEFASGLQQEIAESLSFRPKKITPELFAANNLALTTYERLIKEDYISNGTLTEKYYSDREAGTLDYPPEVIRVLDSVYSPESIRIDDGRKQHPKITLDREKLNRPEFLDMWDKINHRSVYSTEFDDSELVQRASADLNSRLNVAGSTFVIERGGVSEETGQGFTLYSSRFQEMEAGAGKVKFDVAGSLSEITGLTRELIIKILKCIAPEKLKMFAVNPEMFITRASQIINEAKGSIVVQHISYNMLEDTYSMEIFTDAELTRPDAGKLKDGLKKSLYDAVECDSQTEKVFAESLDADEDVELYTKLPREFCIDTPLGKYNPDWAIVLKSEGEVKHVYLIAETKGAVSPLQIRPIEQAKIACARRHFEAVSNGGVNYHVVNTFSELLMNHVKG